MNALTVPRPSAASKTLFVPRTMIFSKRLGMSGDEGGHSVWKITWGRIFSSVRWTSYLDETSHL
jgi:hypothetical protein